MCVGVFNIFFYNSPRKQGKHNKKKNLRRSFWSSFYFKGNVVFYTNESPPSTQWVSILEWKYPKKINYSEDARGKKWRLETAEGK